MLLSHSTARDYSSQERKCGQLLVGITSFVLFFFFQAEDGIRDLYVTGVQTCALPISNNLNTNQGPGPGGGSCYWRSEERRVGKECRSRWSPHHEKKNRATTAGRT